MTLQEALDRGDTLRPNMIPRQEKIAWLSEVEGLLHREIILAHEHDEELDTFDGYDVDTDEGQVLLAPFPYDDLYPLWLLTKIDMMNMELDKYNNDRTVFNNSWGVFQDAWRRGHMPIQKSRELRI
jgi:hypothetical protein